MINLCYFIVSIAVSLNSNETLLLFLSCAQLDHVLVFLDKQVLLFSATFNETVKDFVARTVKDPNQLYVKREDLSLDSVKQYKVICPREENKIEVIKDRIMELGDIGQTIIFVRTKVSAGKLHKALTEMGYDVTSVHGSMSEDERDKIVREFKDCLTQVLIATDVIARGFDQQRVKYDPKTLFSFSPVAS